MSISPQDFDFVSKLLRAECAIVLEKGKEYLVESRLAPICRDKGFPTLEGLVAALKGNADSGLKQQVVEAMTTNETSFFRDIEPFENLRKVILPEIIEKRTASRTLNIWCAASSTGQEPYSIAMLLREHFPQLNDWKISFIASDISQEVLARAKSGRYSQLEVNRGLPVTYLVKYFKKEGTDWFINEDIRKMIRFEAINLVKPFSIISDIDLVMIRNVLIYFEVDIKKNILAKIRKIMKPDGFLLLGAAETTLNLDDNFIRRAVGKGSCYVLKG